MLYEPFTLSKQNVTAQYDHVDGHVVGTWWVCGRYVVTQIRGTQAMRQLGARKKLLSRQSVATDF
jgi:hypothetical protein